MKALSGADLLAPVADRSRLGTVTRAG